MKPPHRHKDASAEPDARAGRRKPEARLFLFFLALGGLVLSAWWTAPALMPLLVPGFGATTGAADPYEAVAALFSGLAFVGLLAALAFQRRDLKLQRKELRRYRKEIRLQRRELAAAVEAQQESAHALKERIEQQESHAHQALSVDLLKEWHSAAMQESRDLVDRRIVEQEEQGALPLPRLVRYDPGGGDRADREAFHVFRILHFFEKLSDLVEARLIDVPLVAKLLGTYVEYWDDHLFEPLRRGEPPAHLHEVKLAKVEKLAGAVRLSRAAAAPIAPPEAAEAAV